MDERRSGPPPARELPLWKRLGRALARAVWPIAGAKNDPWLADDADLDPDMAHAERDAEAEAARRREEPPPPERSEPPRSEP
jgi:hypothetical protein